LDFEYSAVEVTKDTLTEFVSRVKSGEFAGFNLTMPLKETIIPYLDAIDDVSRACGSVNTVVNRGGELVGYTTDGIGAVRTVFGVIGEENLHGASVLVLGVGGAAKSACYALSGAGANVISLSRREDLPTIHGATVRPWGELCSLAATADVLINCTPQGMAGRDEFADFAFLDALSHQPSLMSHRSDGIVFDMVYSPLETRLIREAKSRGLRAVNGIPMLVHQAAASWELFTGARADAATTERLLLAKISQ
jgi:shikimate dehydrogenase